MIPFSVPTSLSFLRAMQREAIGARLSEAGDVYIDQLIESARIDPEQATLVLVVMESADVCVVYRDIFHGCSDHPVAKRRYDRGLPPLPWRCPECEEEVVDLGELSYEVFGHFADGVTID